MCLPGHQPLSLPVGLLSIAIVALALLRLKGRLESQSSELELGENVVCGSTVLRQLGLLVAASLLLLLALRSAVSGSTPAVFGFVGLWVTAACLGCILAAFFFLQTLRAQGPKASFRGLLRRGGFWLVLLSVLLQLPLLGSFSLIDPWETHYGEVAREMLMRDDWISLWWAQDGWFWSKPVLDFWMQGLSFGLLGVAFQPDQMLAAAQAGLQPEPEWAARFPIFLAALVASYLLYRAVRQVWGQMAALIGGVALSSMPYWYFLARQSVTDMAYVAPMVAAMALMFMAVNTDPGKLTRVTFIRLGKRHFEVSLFQALIVLLLGLVLPQALYLISRNFTLATSPQAFGLHWHSDTFLSGSGGGNCGLPGNSACHSVEPTFAMPQPAVMGVGWLGVLGYLLWSLRRERRTQRLLFLFAWVAVALSTLGKGAPGLLLPLCTLVAFALVTGRIGLLKRANFPAFFLIFACITLPWFVQMIVRHGGGFTERLLWHDMYKRAFNHVHDTNANTDVSFRYYLWQLGYGLFPWTGLAAVGLGTVLFGRRETTSAKQAGLTFFFLWFLCAFGLFSLSLTKFHHYILPAVPPIAVLTAVTFAPLLEGYLPTGWRALTYWALLGGCALALLAAASSVLVGAWLDVRLLPALGYLLVSGVAFFGAQKLAQRGPYTSALTPASLQPPLGENGGARAQLLYGPLALGSACVLLAVGRDLFVTIPGDIPGQSRLITLFTYIYDRAWPASLDFTRPLGSFLVALVLASLLVCVRRVQAHAFALFCALSLLWAAFGINVYLTATAAHWGQRSTILAYYRARTGPNEPLIAFQMNWKGENFYTGNRLPAFVTSGKPFATYIKAQLTSGRKVLYFSAEHSRIGGLKRELGRYRTFTPITTARDNNKFFVARVEF